MQLSFINHTNDFLTINKIRNECNQSLFYFVRESEIYNSFDCDEIKKNQKDGP